MTATFELNKKFNGIEVTFPERPEAEVRRKMKTAGFRWHGTRRLWYAKQTEERMALAKSLSEEKKPVRSRKKAIKNDPDLCGDGTPLAEVGREIFEQAKQKASEAAAPVTKIPEEAKPVDNVIKIFPDEPVVKKTKLTSKTRLSGLKKMVTLSTQKSHIGNVIPDENDGQKYYIVHEHWIAHLNKKPNEEFIGLPERNLIGVAQNAFKTTNRTNYVQVPFPDYDEVKKYLADHKTDWKTNPIMVGDDEHHTWCNPNYLLMMLQVFQNAEMYLDIGYRVPMILFKNSDEEKALLLPINH